MRLVLRAAVIALCVAVSVVVAVPERSPAALTTCTEPVVRSLALNFTRSFNRAEWRRVDRLWIHSDFRWYSANQVQPPVTHTVTTRAGLIPLLRQRHLSGERLGLASLRLTSAIPGRADFVFRIYRRADDLRNGDTALYAGKGVAYCHPAAQLAVWSMGAAP